MFTDVDIFTMRGLTGNAVNLSCGYYRPHSAREYIVLGHAMQTLLDAYALLVTLSEQQAAAVAREVERQLALLPKRDIASASMMTEGISAK